MGDYLQRWLQRWVLCFLVGYLLGCSCHAAEIDYATAYSHADKTPMVLVYTTPWCPNCHPYVKRLVSDGIDVVHFENDSIFPLVPHTCVRVRKGEQNYGFDFTGAMSTETIKAAIESCKERVK